MHGRDAVPRADHVIGNLYNHAQSESSGTQAIPGVPTVMTAS